MEEQSHEGHRQRLLDKYLTEGLPGLNQIEVVELILTFAIPRKDVRPLAIHLLAHFRGLQGIMDAPLEELLALEGVTPRAAALLRMFPQVWGRYDLARIRRRGWFETSQECGDFLCAKLRESGREEALLMCLDVNGRMLKCSLLCIGNLNSVGLSICGAVDTAVEINSAAVVLAHNHMIGSALPSVQDIETTWRIRAAMEHVGIYLLDHIVVAANDYVSMRDSEML